MKFAKLPSFVLLATLTVSVTAGTVSKQNGELQCCASKESVRTYLERPPHGMVTTPGRAGCSTYCYNAT